MGKICRAGGNSSKFGGFMKKYFFPAALVLGTLACATVTNLTSTQPTPAVATSVSIQPTIIPTATVGDIVRREDVELYCPSEIPAAAEAYNKALTFESAGDDASAEQSYREAIDLDPEYCDAMDNLALVLKRAGNYEETISLYQRSISIYPESYTAHLGLANSYARLEQYDNAIAEFETLLKLYPDDAEGYYGIGNVYFNQEKYEEAIIQFKTAEEIYKTQGSDYIVDAQANIGYSYVLLEDYVAGRDYLEMVFPYFEDDGYTNYVLGICYYYGESIRDDTLAKQYLTRARDLGFQLDSELEKFVNTP
jgi:tetratricopeptide (TPR) repeat protein